MKLFAEFENLYLLHVKTFTGSRDFNITFFRFFIGLVIIGYASYIIVEVVLVSPQNLVSGLGYVVYVLLFYIFSAAPGKVGSAISCYRKKSAHCRCCHLS